MKIYSMNKDQYIYINEEGKGILKEAVQDSEPEPEPEENETNSKSRESSMSIISTNSDEN